MSQRVSVSKTRAAVGGAGAGYSGTPLFKKLGIKPGGTVVLVGALRNYATLVAPLPAGARLTTRLSSGADIVHIFSVTRTRLERAIRDAIARMAPATAIWASWPKQASKVPTDITENTIREIALPLGLVDIKVCAVDATWSGLKLVTRQVPTVRPRDMRPPRARRSGAA